MSSHRVPEKLSFETLEFILETTDVGKMIAANFKDPYEELQKLHRAMISSAVNEELNEA